MAKKDAKIKPPTEATGDPVGGEIPPTTAAEAGEPVPMIRRDSAGDSSPLPKQRLSIPLTEAGGIDFSTMRSDTTDKLRHAISSDPGVAAKLGLIGEKPAAVFDAATASQLWGALGAAEAFLAERMWGVKPEDAARIFAYDPNELAVLGQPTADVLNKYVPDVLGKYREEMALLFVIIHVHKDKVAAIRQIMANQGAPGPTPVPARVQGAA